MRSGRRHWGGYLAVLELGLGGALLPLLARAMTRGQDELRRTLAAGFRRTPPVAVIMFAVALVLPLVITRLVPVQPTSPVTCGLASRLPRRGRCS